MAAVTKIEKSGEVIRIEFERVNAAPSCAAAVTVTGEILGENTAVETAAVTFDYVPAQSKARGALLLRTDLASGELRLRPTGYAET